MQPIRPGERQENWGTEWRGGRVELDGMGPNDCTI
jgi:hypothetical protein